MSSLKRNKASILFITNYPLNTAPGSRFRYELFLKDLEGSYTLSPTLTHSEFTRLYTSSSIQKALIFIRGFFRRLASLRLVFSHEIIFIFRESYFLGPPLFEFIIAKIFRKKIIYDFDDAIWLPDPNENSPLLRFIKWKSKVRLICRWSWKVSAGNEYLADFAGQYCDSVVVIPTVVNTDYHVPAPQKNNKITIGWTGSHTTLQYLNPLVPTLDRLCKKYDISFAVIANKDPELPIAGFKFIAWDQSREVSDLQQFDIGIMPLTDDIWSQGKCGFKAIQYGATGIPALLSPVGVNKDVVKNNVSGYWCNTPDEWESRLEELIKSSTLRKEMGEAGRAHIEAHFSVKSIKERFLKLFEV